MLWGDRQLSAGWRPVFTAGSVAVGTIKSCQLNLGLVRTSTHCVVKAGLAFSGWEILQKGLSVRWWCGNRLGTAVEAESRESFRTQGGLAEGRKF